MNTTAATGHVVLRGAELVLSTERDAACVVRCLACGAESESAGQHAKAAAVWAVLHAHEGGLEHGQFLVTTWSHWRVRLRCGG
ncbi:DUF7848 domain-containing protein [Streptomyces sp. 6N223]|uniref:DUF7848 domain-containing protein n=1 Tax=Streptomyces sp. 6N223 TaxID=3457412 RepID=UPI003FCFF7FA